jgi:hypothetical protein
MVCFWDTGNLGSGGKGEFGRSSRLRHPPRNLSATFAIHLCIKSEQTGSDDITFTAKSTSHNFIVAFRASLRKMTNFKVDIVSDTVCRKSLETTHRIRCTRY